MNNTATASSVDSVATPRSSALTRTVSVIATVVAASIFGFFFAWVCSTMWGLDAADPRVAIEAMQAMNASVRNFVFAPAFFGTPLVLGAAAFLARRDGASRSARWMVAGALIYLVGGLALTMAVNVPMNEELASMVVPSDVDEARRIWDDYSPTWQLWNVVRTVASGAAVVCAALGLMDLRGGSRTPTDPRAEGA